MAKEKNSVSVAAILKAAIVVIMIMFIGAMLIFYFSFPDVNSAPTFFNTGYCFFITRSDNMEDKIEKDSLIIGTTDVSKYDLYGRTVICDFDGALSTLWVSGIDYSSSTPVYTLSSRNAPANETILAGPNEIYAVALRSDPLLGKFLIFATSTTGIRLSIIIPSLMMILYQIIRIVKVRKLEEEAALLDDIDDFGEAVAKHRNPEQQLIHDLPSSSGLQPVKMSVSDTGKAVYSKAPAPTAKISEFENALAKTMPRSPSASAQGAKTAAAPKPVTINRPASANPIKQPATVGAGLSPSRRPDSTPKIRPITPAAEVTPPIISLTKPIDKDELERAVIKSTAASSQRQKSFMEKYTTIEMAEKHSAARPPVIPPLVEPKPLKEPKTPPAPMSEDDLVQAIAQVKAKKETQTQAAPPEQKPITENESSQEKHWMSPEFSAEILPAVARAKTFEESVQGFMESSKPSDTAAAVPTEAEEKEDKLPAPTAQTEKPSTIPSMAVTPKETMAPPPKRQSNKTVEELMRVIDRAEKKMKK